MAMEPKDGHDATKSPRFTWADRYDAIGLAAGLPVGVALVVLFSSTGLVRWQALPFYFAVANVTAYLSRRRAGVPQITLWERYRRSRRRRESKP